MRCGFSQALININYISITVNNSENNKINSQFAKKVCILHFDMIECINCLYVLIQFR